ncbi:hypothetical protein C5F59_015080 [Streptomyces sp. QL37]|uniref:aromatic-ring hydroxylase C-terminal domain-containing protein n=1 Tax=Streptomyces sp. QL37 TaxID=2093747 RepID=UPI00137518B0|nr:hypothetical protein [Streptomyces sp. QL37]
MTPTGAGRASPARSGKGLFLIRPDGYVGWAGEDTTGLAEYAGPLGLDLNFA